MGDRRYFSLLHPVVLLLFCVMAIGVSMSLFHPVYTLLSLFCAMACFGFLRGAGALGRALKGAVILAVGVAVINPLINQRGVRVWFYLFDRVITVESALFGLCSGCALAAALLWFGAASALISEDQFLFLFSRFLPGVSLMLAMTMKLVPVTRYKIRCIEAARRGLGGSDGESARQKLEEGVRTCSILLEWSMEDSIDTADSMRARGFGTGPRSFMRIFSWHRWDAFVAAVLLALSGACIFGMARYGAGFRFFPKLISEGLWEPGAWIGYGACLLLLTSPLWVEGISRLSGAIRAWKRKKFLEKEGGANGAF